MSGATISRATLHNWSEIERLGISKGCTVVVERAGEVIPRIVRTVINKDENNEIVKPPTKCPACNASVIREGSSDLRCTAGFQCNAQRLARLEHFAGRKGLAIPGMVRPSDNHKR